MDRFRRHPIRVVACLGVAALVVAVVAAGFVPQAKASPTGWSIVVGGPGNPGNTPSDALLLGDTCADAWSCWAVGVSGSDVSSPSPVKSTLNSTTAPFAIGHAAALQTITQTGGGGASSSSVPQALVEHWNGSSWSTVPVAQPSNTADSLLYNVTCVTQSDCWAVGGDDASQSNATQPAGPPAVAINPAPVAAAASTKAPIPVTSTAPSGAAALVEHWNGIDWSMATLPTTSGYLYSVACPSADDCWAVGSSLDSSDDPLNSFALHWNGTSWTNAVIPASGQTYDELNSVTCPTQTDCWAVGTASANPITDQLFPNVFPNVQDAETYFVHWNGSTWSRSPTTDPSSPTGAYLSGVACVNSSECWAVGTTVDQFGNPQNVLVERWNGSSWALSPAGSPGVDAQLSNVSCVSATDCWAAGTVGTVNGGNPKQTAVTVNGNSGPPVPFVERWDGGNWWVESTPYVTSDSLLYGMACVHGAQCFATGGATTNLKGSGIQPLVEETGELSVDGQGFYAAGADGGVFNFGDAGFDGSMSGTHLNAPVMGIAATPDRKGYWEVGADGGVFTFGDAGFYGSMGGVHLNAPIVGIASTPDGRGYWEVAADGGVFAFGDAGFYKSMGGTRLDAPVLGLASTPDGRGYWEVAADGGVFAFGDAGFYGSMGGTRLDAHMVGIASTPDGDGYWEVAADGGVFAFGDAGFNGSTAGDHLYSPVVGMSMTPDGRGYWLITSSGAVYNEGDANWLGSLNDIGLTAPITSLSSPA